MNASLSTLPLLALAKPTASLTCAAPSSRSPRKRIALPHFTSSNGADFPSPRRHHHSSNPERFEPQDSLSATLDKAVRELHATEERIVSCFERISQTQSIFELELDETDAMMDRLHYEQQRIATAYYNYFNYSALQIQRLFRGYLGRRVYRQTMALKAALRIQRGFRAMRRRRADRLKQFRVMCRKVLRGMRGIRAKEELSHKELLNRVNHNMMIETQWRKAMGVGDTESSLIHALYRKKFMRRRIGAVFRAIHWTHSIVRYWRTLVPEPESIDARAAGFAENLGDGAGDGNAEALLDTEAMEEAALLEWNLQQQLQLSDTTAARRNVNLNRPKLKAPPKKVLSREELRRKQQAYTQRVQEENAKRENSRAALQEKQKEAARLSEIERKRFEDEQRRLRMQHATALREDLERRGLLAIKELQSKKDEELRRQEEAKLRLVNAQQRIAAQVLSDETQQILKRKQRSGSNRKLQ
ncbi:hypothetical protein Gpo141_00006963 [Globisporangium polare]